MDTPSGYKGEIDGPCSMHRYNNEHQILLQNGASPEPKPHLQNLSDIIHKQTIYAFKGASKKRCVKSDNEIPR